MKVGSLEGAKQLVEHCLDVLMIVPHHQHPLLTKVFSRYRQLGKQIQDKYNWAIIDLADDLRKLGCNPDTENFRAEIGVILWSLGLLPESQIFKSTANPLILPSSNFFQRLVRQSLDRIPYDPLVQYLWLEMKDRPPFNIRNHEALFSKINLKYGQSLFDDDALLFPVPPSRLYAQTLISWFKGELHEERAAEYFSTMRLMNQLAEVMDLHVVQLRMAYLGYILAKEFGQISPDREDQIWYSLNDQASGLRELLNIYPELPDAQSSTNLVLFHLIEHEFSQTTNVPSSDRTRMEKILDAVEQIRASGLSYWLKITPPMPQSGEQGKLTSLLKEEQQLLERLRAADFLLHYRLLPHYFRRFQIQNVGDIVRNMEPPYLEKINFDPDAGRQHYREVEDKLETLFEQMQKTSPNYARKRLRSQASLEDLTKAINSHANS